MHAEKDRGNYRSPPMPPFRLNAYREGMRDSEKEDRVNYRPPPKPPYILNVDWKVIGITENGNLPYIVPESRPPPEPSPKGFNI